MELGIGMFGDLEFDQTTGKYKDAGIKIREILEQVKLMDEVGIDVFAMGEHHREDYAVSSPEMVLAAVDFARKNGLKIIPLCPFANATFQKNVDLQDVLNS